MAASLSSSRSDTLLDEQFTDGERNTQRPPASSAWYLDATSGAYSSSVAGGAWSILPPAPPSKISAVSCFSSALVSLSPGESLTVSATLRPAKSGGMLRLGVFDSAGSRLVKDSNGASTVFAKYQGYSVTCTPATGAIVLERRSKSAAGLWTASAFQPLAASTVALPEEGSHPVSITFERTANGKLSVISEVEGTRSMATESKGVTAFDTIAVQIDGQMGLTALENIRVVKVSADEAAQMSEAKVAEASPANGPMAMAALAGGSTWYLQFSHTNPLDWNSLGTWFSATAGGGTNPAAISASDSFNLNRFRVYSPLITSGTATFGGGEIVISPSGTLAIRGSNGTTAVVSRVVATGGAIMNFGGGTQNWVFSELSVPAGTLSITKNATVNWTNAITTGTLSGTGNITFGGNGGHILNFANAYQFTGSLAVSSGTMSLVNNLTTSGALVINEKARINLTKSIAVTALTLTGTSITPALGDAPKSYTYPPGTYTYAQLNAAYPAIFESGTTGATITVRGGVKYYLRINQPGGNSWTNAYAGDWNTQANGAGIAAPAVNPVDDYSTNGKALRTPTVADTFLGRTLFLEGGSIVMKNPRPEVCTIPTMVATSGTILHYLGTSGTSTLRVNYFTQNPGTTNIAAQGTQSIDLNIDYLSGSGNLRFPGGGENVFTVYDASQFTGTYTQASGTLRLSPVTSGPVHAVGSPFAMKGRLVVNAGAKVVLNRDAYVGGLTVSGSTINTGTYAASALGFTGTAKIAVYTPDLAGPQQMFGVNFASGTFSLDGALIPTYVADWDFYKARGLTLIRVPIKWQQMQPTLGQPLHAGIMGKLATVLALANQRGMKVIFDMHNYGVYKDDSQVIGGSISYASYQDVWERLSQYFASNPDRAALYGFDIMNEPVKMPGDTWQTAVKHAIAGIRKHDMTSYIIVEGKGWSGSQDWKSRNTDLGAVDPACRVIYSAHSYWANSNNDGYGSYDSENAYPNKSIDKMRPFVDWVKKRKFYGFIGEYGVPTNVASPDLRWHDLLRNGLQFMRDNGISGTYWANGRAFGGYHLAADSGTTPVQEAPPMSVVKDFHQ